MKPSERTTCRAGHPWSPENTVQRQVTVGDRRRTERRCRTCMRQYHAAYDRKRQRARRRVVVGPRRPTRRRVKPAPRWLRRLAVQVYATLASGPQTLAALAVACERAPGRIREALGYLRNMGDADVCWWPGEPVPSLRDPATVWNRIEPGDERPDGAP